MTSKICQQKHMAKLAIYPASSGIMKHCEPGHKGGKTR